MGRANAQSAQRPVTHSLFCSHPMRLRDFPFFDPDIRLKTADTEFRVSVFPENSYG